MFQDMSSTSGSGSSEGRTRTFSLRLTEAEHAKVRQIAERLGTTEASVIRFAIRSMLNRVAPLYDPNARGLSLIPVFVECGAELTSYFDLDVARLERIINGDSGGNAPRVDSEDLALLSMSGLGKTRVHAKLRELLEQDVEHEEVAATLQAYFYDKYIYRSSPEKGGD